MSRAAGVVITSFAVLTLGCTPSVPATTPSGVTRPGAMVAVSDEIFSQWATGELGGEPLVWREPAWEFSRATSSAVTAGGVVALVYAPSSGEFFDARRAWIEVYEGGRVLASIKAGSERFPSVAFGRERTLLVVSDDPPQLRVLSLGDASVTERESIALTDPRGGLIPELGVSPSGLRGVAFSRSSGELVPLFWDPRRRTYKRGKPLSVRPSQGWAGPTLDVSDSHVALLFDGEDRLFEWGVASLRHSSCPLGTAQEVALSQDRAFVHRGGSTIDALDLRSCSSTRTVVDGPIRSLRTGCGPDGRDVLAFLRAERKELAWSYVDELEAGRFETVPFGDIERDGKNESARIRDFSLSRCAAE